MPRTGPIWAISAGVTVAVAAMGLAFFAYLVAGIVATNARHPQADSFAPLAIFAAMVLIGWTPLLAWVIWLFWRGSVLKRTGIDSTLPVIAEHLGVDLPGWFWTGWRTGCRLVPVVLGLCLWQGLAENHPLPRLPVLAVQWAVLIWWTVSSWVVLAKIEPAVHRGTEPATMPS